MSQIYSLTKDTNIVEKSVVSKRLFQNKNASVDIYAFDEGEELDHEMLFIDSLAWVIDGEAQLEYGKKQMKLGYDEACLIEAKTWRKLKFTKKTKYLLIDFKENVMIDHLPKAAIFSLVDAVEYEKGKIVSKTLVKNENGSMSLLSFDTDQELSTHAAPGDALLIALDGEMKLTIGDEHFDIKKGDTIVLPGKIPHGLKIKDKFKMLLIVTKDKM
ncbi:cupin domain-containing protein [Campylobacter concisus]|uniref:cupin domain-containing protein n=1 Tax=Campylobacter concisus TaxID=199 RepID=UPI000B3D6403|nr:cupin domain-containing protein [Campylobacter concisus]MBE9818203.1 cupin domain-containing protein [Campylobacter concisus]OUT13037.1 cupin [Campylobacter concisus]